jgi:hypothetical protein
MRTTRKVGRVSAKQRVRFGMARWRDPKTSELVSEQCFIYCNRTAWKRLRRRQPLFERWATIRLIGHVIMLAPNAAIGSYDRLVATLTLTRPRR